MKINKEGKVVGVSRICRECWEEDRKIVPLYEFSNGEDIIWVHNHKLMKTKEKILEALK